MTTMDIRERVISIIEKQLNVIWPKDIRSSDTDSAFKDLKLSGMDLFYLLLEIQKSFEVTIPYSGIVTGSFKSLNSIVNLVKDCLVAGGE